MLTDTFKKKPNQLDDTIAKLVAHLDTIPADSTEFAHVTDQLVKLYTLRDNTKSKKRVSPDAWVSAAASLAGIGIIVSWEHLHPLASKALAFVGKPK
jgi:hypothetical protein